MRRLTALVAALLVTASPVAAAQVDNGAEFQLSPTEVTAGGRVTVTAFPFVCSSHGGPGPVTSPGFVAPIQWGSAEPAAAGPSITGVGTAIATPGTYTATLECLDGQSKAERTFTIVEPPPVRAFDLYPLEVEPGGEINARMSVVNDCPEARTITSPGFVAPLTLEMEGGNFPELLGKTTVVSTPGTYQAVMTCRDGPFSVSFTVLGTPPRDPPQTEPKQPVKKPKGAPETGGGGTS
ncbi:hypothetical protein AB0A74_24535 [Saccharothrix sp. NPDC042600]|uniref:hypothetical protein n=1 Tax=Saccharothrix TaxID=2071 RepID=UPI0033E97C15|nr:hypothetical protein GCM10017745_15000 [Saccharothrix mutabilis subsp. capreolus]